MFYLKKHHLLTDLKKVHSFLNNKFNIEQQAIVDIEKAKKMETYLREFKKIGQKNFIENNSTKYQTELETQAIRSIAQKVGQSLHVGQQRGYSLFRNEHFWDYSDQTQKKLKELQADDIFEAELAELLRLAGEEAIQESNINLGVAVVGNQEGNINQQGLKEFNKLPEMIIKKTYTKINKQGQTIINKSEKKSKVITKPQFKSGKIDVAGYNANYLIEANIQSQWIDFIQTFTGANFTVKNYSSNSSTETIHLGNTNLYKVFYGTLADSLGFDKDEAIHIFYHTINSKTSTTPPEGDHVIHIRFAYELTGEGLYDKDGNRIDTADFFIYNDPASENIWVRSTKEMIAKILDYVGNISDPLYSNIVILKNVFK